MTDGEERHNERVLIIGKIMANEGEEGFHRLPIVHVVKASRTVKTVEQGPLAFHMYHNAMFPSNIDRPRLLNCEADSEMSHH
jgi:hypothetical protein